MISLAPLVLGAAAAVAAVAVAPHAPRGWNSWDCCDHSDEQQVLRTARFMSTNLMEFGYYYVVVDVGM